MAEWLRLNKINAGILIILMSIAAAGGWWVNGWRLSWQIAGKDAEITRLSGELTRQNDAIAVLGREASPRKPKQQKRKRKRSSYASGQQQKPVRCRRFRPVPARKFCVNRGGGYENDCSITGGIAGRVRHGNGSCKFRSACRVSVRWSEIRTISTGSVAIPARCKQRRRWRSI